MAEGTWRTFIIIVGILDLVRWAIIGSYSLGLALYLIALLFGCTHHLAEEFIFRASCFIDSAIIVGVLWPITAVFILLIYLIDDYHYTLRALKLYPRCKRASRIIRLNRALWKIIWPDDFFRLEKWTFRH